MFICAFIPTGLLLAGCGASDSRAAGPRDPASSPGEGIHALGRLEPTNGLVTVGARPGGRIESIPVKPGDQVFAGQILAVLEGNAQAKAQVAVAEAAKAKGEHARSLEKSKLAIERAQADKLKGLRTEPATHLRMLASQAMFEEMSKLYKQLSGTLQGKEKFDLIRSFQEADARFLRDSLEVRSYEASQEFVTKQRQLEDQQLDGPSPDLELLDRQVALARASLALTEVHAPAAGQVLEILARPGEISAGPLLLLGDLSGMVAAAEVFQADIPSLKLGDPATVQVLDREVTGKVTRIGSVVVRNQINPIDPRALQDRRVIKVQVGLDDPTFAARFINMEVEIAIHPGASADRTSATSKPAAKAGP
ncbi:HlyD family efflux transporter periplasmic adaptor subunit [Aquisphaera insulae]|uniref:HlyD family efflux transporter periplasmic adaptor subunit n=1 Tax=Aquisphaera insulae TaxID=2712864 RepID=UPI0013ECB2D1|nr:HlyD family efflux transporter periplasmic adaptor subunit [Aquisphaera insulae]